MQLEATAWSTIIIISSSYNLQAEQNQRRIFSLFERQMLTHPTWQKFHHHQTAIIAIIPQKIEE